MVLQKILFQIFLDNKDIVIVLLFLHIIYMVLRRHKLFFKYLFLSSCRVRPLLFALIVSYGTHT